jgi:sulfur carrier protein ThiS adenylyltransferase
MPKVEALRDNILRINPDVEVVPHIIKLTPESILKLYKDCDVIVEAFDLAEMKQMIIETVLTHMPDKYIVSGDGLAGWGNNNMLTTQQIGKLFICGDQQIEVSDELPPLAPRVGIVANMQANQVLEILMTT